MLRQSTLVWVALAILGCSKTDKKEGGAGSAGSAATGSGSATAGSGSAEGSAEPVEAATVVGPTKSAKGPLTVTGALTGTFEWKKKDQKSPISCAWDATKEIGSTAVDVSDGAGKLLSLSVDVPPDDLGLPSLNIKASEGLSGPLKTSLGFNVSGDADGNITVKFTDTKLGGDDKKPELTINGTLEVSCPKKN